MVDERYKSLDAEPLHNLLDLISAPLKTLSDFKLDVLKFLLDNFSAEHLWFFTIDETNKFMDPIFINANEHSLKEYLDYYHKICIHNPNNNPLFLRSNKNVFTINDIMPLKEFEKTIYYQEHLRRDNYYYPAVAYLKFEGALLGAISMCKPKEGDDFTRKEVGALEYISSHISNRLCDYMELNKLQSAQQLFGSFIQENPNGLILLNGRYSIVTFNPMAQELCNDILSKSKNVIDPVRTFVNNLIPRIAKDKNISTSLQLDQKSYNLKIVPCLVFNARQALETYFLIYINRSETLNKMPNYLLASNFNLTGREIEIVELIAKGLTNKEIADILLISSNTVRTHTENIRGKVGVKNKLAVLQKLSELS